MTHEEKKNAIRSYLAAYNSFDIEGMVALVHPELVFENVSGGEVTARTEGIDQFRQLASQSKALFSSRHQAATKFTFVADTVTVDINYKGVLAVDLSNGMKAGEVLQLNGRSEFKFKDGKMFRISDFS